MDYFYDPINIDLNELRITVLAAPQFNKAFIPAWERRPESWMPVKRECTLPNLVMLGYFCANRGERSEDFWWTKYSTMSLTVSANGVCDTKVDDLLDYVLSWVVPILHETQENIFWWCGLTILLCIMVSLLLERWSPHNCANYEFPINNVRSNRGLGLTNVVHEVYLNCIGLSIMCGNPPSGSSFLRGFVVVGIFSYAFDPNFIP